MVRKDGTLQGREFVFFCEDQLMAALPAGFPQPQRRVMWTILQLSYADPAFHFELQPLMGRSQVELGLHFEGPLDENERWASEVADRALTLMAALGPGWDLEEWTPSWRRLHRVFHFTRFDLDFAREVAGQFTTLVTTLQPLFGPTATPQEPLVRVIGGKGRSERWHNRSRARR
ncbi:MAG TPA: hypothetical protein VIK11_07380 [Tepidiformaceae bacterium]